MMWNSLALFLVSVQAAAAHTFLAPESAVEMPKVSRKAQKCFTKVIFGKSPGSNMGSSTEPSVDDCLSKCAGLEGCLAMTFRLEDGLCNLLNRTYDAKYEESDERVVANKLDKCKSTHEIQVFDKAEVGIKVSEEAQKLFTKVVFGKSPGSNMGNSMEGSVDDCMLKCAALEGCLSMSFRLSDGLCNFLNRTYDGKFEESDERLLANKIDSTASPEFKPFDKTKMEMSNQVSDNAVVYEMPKVSKHAQKCFTKVIFGKSPGGNLGNSTETSVDACLSKCAALEGCLAMTFRLSDGLCNFLNRTYDDKFEESNERLLANKLDGCKPKTSHEVEVFDKTSVGIKVSEEAQECFTNVKFGRSPGSNTGNSTESSADECLLKCALIPGCMAVTFRMSDGLCNYLDRPYDDKYEESDERLLANKKESCKTKPSSGFFHKLYEIFTFPFRKLASLFSNLLHIF